MGLFNKRKDKGNSVVWRDASGKITCPGDNCPKDCDDTCPIYLNTQAGMMCQIGMGDKAMPIFQKIIEIAPDFYDAWNNMGGVYGGQGQYQKAYDCYLKAHEISPDRPAPVFGLGLTTRDLKRYEECLKWCDEYDRIFKDHRLDDTRNIALAALGKPTQKRTTPKF